MRRTRAPNNSATLPALTSPSAEGYYKDRDGLTPGTVVTAAELNIIQEELVALAVLKGATPDATGADKAQCATAVKAVRAIETESSSALEDGATAVSTLDGTAIIASATITAGSNGGTALGAASGDINNGSTLIATLDASAQGTQGLVAASYGSSIAVGAQHSAAMATTGTALGADADRSAAIATNGGSIGDASQSLLAATSAATIAGTNCAAIGGDNNDVGGTTVAGQVGLASKYLDATSDDYSVQGGYHADTPTGPTWRIRSNGGHITGDGTVAGGGADFAEMLPNGDDAPHAPGRLLARKGGAVRLAAPGDRIAGFVSVSPTMVGNADDLAWQGRWLRDEWGAYVLDEVGDRILNPDYDRTREHASRRDRPAEWTCVGLVGQGLIAVDETVRPDDDVIAGPDGIGTRGEWVGRGRQVECMEIVQAFDAAKGYAIARCLVA